MGLSGRISGFGRGLGLAGLWAAIVITSSVTRADEAGVGSPDEPSSTELAIGDQSPVTRFYIARIEDNVQFGYGPDREVLNFFRIQPLVPIELPHDWTLLLRTIIPVVHVPWPETKNGLGDVSLIAFLTPHDAGSLVWGVGPAFLLPTATDDGLGTGRWSAGPSIAAAYTRESLFAGALIQLLWSFAGDAARPEVGIATLRPILSYNLPAGWYLTTSPTITANWEASTDERWLVPVGGGVGRVFGIARQRMSTTVEAYYHVVSPALGPEWQLRIQLSALYPH